MIQHRKRILLYLITLAFVVCLMPTGVFADESDSGTVAVAAQQMILGDDLTMRFYLTVGESYKENGAVHITVDGEVDIYPLKEIKPNANKQYVFSVDLAAAQMTSAIELDFVVEDKSVFQKAYTIQEYARTILEGKYPAETKQMVIEMLNYGTKAQVYFERNLQKLANFGYEMEESCIIPADVSPVTVIGSLDGIQYYGAALVFDAKLAVRYYFSAHKGVDRYSFVANGVPYDAYVRDDLFYVEIPEINPQDLDKNVDITVTDNNTTEKMVVNYSPMHYVSRMYYKENSSEELKVLLLALYSYHKAAVSFMDESSALDLTPVKPGDYNLNTEIIEL